MSIEFLQISIPLTIRSGNDYVKRSGGWRIRHRDSKLMEKYVWAALSGKVNQSKALGKRRLEITAYRDRMLDVDNLYSGAKPLIDAIKRLGLIVDDAPKFCDLSVSQIKSRPGLGQIGTSINIINIMQEGENGSERGDKQ